MKTLQTPNDTRERAKRSVLLTSAPSAFIVTVLAPLFWVMKDRSGHEWLFWVYLGVIPLSVVVGLLGLLFSLDRSLTRRLRIVLVTLNVAALCFGPFIFITLLRALGEWKGLRQF